MQHFPGGGGGGGATFSKGGGVQMLISIETHITCYFPGGGGGGPDPIFPSGSAHAQASSILVIRMDCLRKTRAFISLHKRAV